MKKFSATIAATVAFSIFVLNIVAAGQMPDQAWVGDSQRVAKPSIESLAVSTTLVVSQLYGGGGGAGSPTYNQDYVEIKNVSSSPRSLNGMALQYGASTGTFGGSGGANIVPLSNVTLNSGQYYLVSIGAPGAGGASLPVTANQSFTAFGMSGSSGKIALTNSTVWLNCGDTTTPCVLPHTSIVDLVAYGAANNAEGAAVNNGSAFTTIQGGKRKGEGCTDTDNNNLDFDVVTNPVPRNSTTTLPTCSGGGQMNLSGFGSASPTTVLAGDTTVLTVSVTPATNPTSTNISVTANLTSVGGMSSQSFFDDGTNGDATPGDNVFTFLEDLPAGTATGPRAVSVSIADAQSHTASATINFTVGSAPDPNLSENMVMGNPSNAVTDVNNPTNYLMTKTQYSLSYHRDNGKPNWVAWHLNTDWLGTANRQNDYRNDPSLPAGWYQVLGSDYSGNVNNGGFDRGHHTPSADRTKTTADNSATFFMTNMMPQAPDNNQGPWQNFESYCNDTLVGTQGNELYIYAGSVGQGGTGLNGPANTVAGGHVVVPAYTWKVVLVLPNQSGDDVARVSASTRVIAIIMPNKQGIRGDAWQKYLATVDQVEALTGYDFYSNVPVQTQAVIESTLDTASNTSPQSVNAGTYTDLNIDGPNTTLNGDITVNGILTLGGSTLITNGHKITFGANATVSRISGMINGQTAKTFTGVSPFTFPVGTAPFQYSPVTANLTALGTNPSTLTVTPHNVTHPGSPDPGFTLKRYWTLTEAGDITANLIFKYVDTDIPAGVTESSLALHRFETSFAPVDGAVLDTSANTATTTTPVGNFSDWTLMRPLAPATDLTVSGRVLNPHRGTVGVRGATVTFFDPQTGLTRTAITDSTGFYSFDNITSGTIFTASARSRGLTYQSRSIPVSSSLTNEDFVAQ